MLSINRITLIKEFCKITHRIAEFEIDIPTESILLMNNALVEKAAKFQEKHRITAKELDYYYKNLVVKL